MSFKKKKWTNRISQFPNRRKLTNEDNTTNVVTFTRDEGTITQPGDAFSATNMNDLEDRIEEGFNAITPINPQADSGYVSIGDTLIQWGRKAFDSRISNSCVQTNIIFPIPFADLNYTINFTLNYSTDFTAYYDATPNYFACRENGLYVKALSKSGGFTTDKFPANAISATWIAIGKI